MGQFLIMQTINVFMQDGVSGRLIGNGRRVKELFQIQKMPLSPSITVVTHHDIDSFHYEISPLRSRI